MTRYRYCSPATVRANQTPGQLIQKFAHWQTLTGMAGFDG